MALDQSFAGRSYPPSAPYQVGREKIREFATAIGATDAACHDPEAARALGHPDVIAPPTFPIALSMADSAQIVGDPALGVDYSRVVHGDQKFVYTRPVVAGDELVCVSTIESINTRVGNDFLTIRSEIGTSAGEAVVKVWTMYVVRGEEG